MKFVFLGSKNPDVDPAEELRLEGRDPVRVGGEVELSAAELELHSARLMFDPVDSKSEKSLERVEREAEKAAVENATEADKQLLGLGDSEEVK